MLRHLIRCSVALAVPLFSCTGGSVEHDGRGASSTTDEQADTAQSSTSSQPTSDTAKVASSSGAPDSAEGSGSGDTETAATSTSGSDTGSGCGNPPASADRQRYVVVSTPYDTDGNAAPTYAVVSLDQRGQLQLTGHTFAMGQATSGRIVFTADGQFGLLAQRDGSVGVFHMPESGEAVALNDGLVGDFYANMVFADPAHERFFVHDRQLASNGGGIYEIAVQCDGTIHEVGAIVSADMPSQLAWTAENNPIIAARTALGVNSRGYDAFVLSTLDNPRVLAHAPAFADGDAIISAIATAAMGQVALVADNNSFSGLPNRISVLSIAGGTVEYAHELGDLNDPYELIASPVDNTALMVSGYGDAIYILDIDPTAAEPVTVRGELDYVDGGPQLPGHGAIIDRGPLSGLALVVETNGIRRIRFAGDGVVTDYGVLDFSSGYENILGAIGVQW